MLDDVESEHPQWMSAECRDRLLDIIGEYGLVHGRLAAQQGADALNRWAIDVSGIRELGRHLEETMMRPAVLSRCARVLRELDSLAVRHPAHEQIRAISHRLQTDPLMTPVVVLRSLQRLLSATPDSPLVEPLTR